MSAPTSTAPQKKRQSPRPNNPPASGSRPRRRHRHRHRTNKETPKIYSSSLWCKLVLFVMTYPLFVRYVLYRRFYKSSSLHEHENDDDDDYYRSSPLNTGFSMPWNKNAIMSNNNDDEYVDDDTNDGGEETYVELQDECSSSFLHSNDDDQEEKDSDNDKNSLSSLQCVETLNERYTHLQSILIEPPPEYYNQRGAAAVTVIPLCDYIAKSTLHEPECEQTSAKYQHRIVSARSHVKAISQMKNSKNMQRMRRYQKRMKVHLNPHKRTSSQFLFGRRRRRRRRRQRRRRLTGNWIGTQEEEQQDDTDDTNDNDDNENMIAIETTKKRRTAKAMNQIETPKDKGDAENTNNGGNAGLRIWPLLITGTPRSGTVASQTALSKLGLLLANDQHFPSNGEYGMVSWMHVLYSKEDIYVGNGKLLYGTFRTILHQRRNVLQSLTSLMYTEPLLAPNYQRFLLKLPSSEDLPKAIRRSLHWMSNPKKNKELLGLIFYVEWQLVVIRLSSWSFRLEDLFHSDADVATTIIDRIFDSALVPKASTPSKNRIESVLQAEQQKHRRVRRRRLDEEEQEEIEEEQEDIQNAMLMSSSISSSADNIHIQDTQRQKQGLRRRRRRRRRLAHTNARKHRPTLSWDEVFDINPICGCKSLVLAHYYGYYPMNQTMEEEKLLFRGCDPKDLSQLFEPCLS